MPPRSPWQRVEALTGKPVTFYKGDILDRDILNKIFAEHKIDCCIHFAGLKAVVSPWQSLGSITTITLQVR